MAILLFICCLLGTLANSLVFWVFNRRPGLRSLSNRFVLSLVTANLLLSAVVGPLLLSVGVVVATLGPIPCLSEGAETVAKGAIYSAIFSTLLIAMDRFYAVTSPLHYSMTITRGRSQVMILLAWAAGFLLSLPSGLLCVLGGVGAGGVALAWVQLLLGYLLPFLSLCWLYLRMYHAAHRNSERTRKHSLSGDLLTVMDGTTSVIPTGGIDLLTGTYKRGIQHQSSSSSIFKGGAGGVVGGGQRRRSSGGSSSSLLFREEGRAIKTAALVLASFLVCWSPHFLLPPPAHPFPRLLGILLSCILNPFIYVFRNKVACQEVTKLLCPCLKRMRGGGKGEEEWRGGASNNNHTHHPPPSTAPAEEGQVREEEEEEAYVPRHTPGSLSKSPKRSSLKSLTPQSSMTSVSGVGTTPVLPLHLPRKPPPFRRANTVPEQPMRVKFPPDLVRQGSCGVVVRQDSGVSVLSATSSSLLVVVGEEEGEEVFGGGEGGGRESGGCCYGRQDSDFSDKTNDSGVGLSEVGVVRVGVETDL